MKEVLEVARRYQKEGIHIDQIVIDFFHWTLQGDWKFDRKYWPDPKAMIDELHSMGIKVIVSVWPSVDRKSENFWPMLDRGLLIKTERGALQTYDFQGDCVEIDVFNPETRKYVWEVCKKNYYDFGIDAFWLDNSEPDFGVYDFDHYRYIEGPALSCSNIYPQLYSRVFYDKKKKDHYMNHMFHGYDMDRTMLRIGAMNMMTHGIDNPFIEYRDSLSDQNQDKEQYSLVLANPPFKGSLDAESVSGDLLKVCKTKKTELLFLTLFLRILKIGGRCACIEPVGVLFGSTKSHESIRKEIVENQRLEAVISMPSGVFKPYAGVSTAILIFTKTEHGGTDHVWFYDMKADGFSLDDKRTPVAENDIPDIIERFKNREKEVDRKRTEQSFMVPKKDIVENEYDLSINKYKEVEYIPVEYPPTSEIMANIRELENEIGKEMDELEKLLKM